MNHQTTTSRRAAGDRETMDGPPLFTQRFVIDDVPCESYGAIRAALPERRLRHTYYQGRLGFPSCGRATSTAFSPSGARRTNTR